MKTKTLPTKDRRAALLDNLPNFDRSGSIRGMKKLYYGHDAKLIRCGKYIYHCTTLATQSLYNQLP